MATAATVLSSILEERRGKGSDEVEVREVLRYLKYYFFVRAISSGRERCGLT